jgi:hypothetical protein
MTGNPKESDWKRYRGMVADLRERYLKEKNQELADMLTSSDKTPTERFWDSLERMKIVPRHFADMTESRRDIGPERILQDCLDPHSRSNMFMSMMFMLRYGMLKEEDLEGFSEELQHDLTSILR